MQTTTYSDPELGAMVAEHGAGWGPRVALFVVTALLAGVFAVAGFAGDEMLLGVISVVVGVALMVLTHVLLSKVRLNCAAAVLPFPIASVASPAAMSAVTNP